MNTTKVQLRTLLQKRKKGFSHAAQIAITTVAAIGIVGAVIANQEGIIGGASQIPGLAVSGVNAYIQGDKLVVEGTARNTGNVIFSSVVIENLRGGHLTLTQDTTIGSGGLTTTHGDVEMFARNTNEEECEINDDGTTVNSTGVGTPANCNGTAVPSFEFVGLTSSDGSSDASGLEAATSKRFRITIDQADNIGATDYSLPHTVPIGTKLTVTLFATDGVTIASSTPKIVSVGR